MIDNLDLPPLPWRETPAALGVLVVVVGIVSLLAGAAIGLLL
jgi:hypothetical protein